MRQRGKLLLALVKKGESIMSRVFRHDGITLHPEVKEGNFEKFMKEELLPYFSERYRGPTRTSIADLKSQSLLKDSKGQGKWLWVTVWDGSPESVRGSSFEHTRMIKFEETKAMLKKLKSFGKRTTEKVFSEVESTEVDTNT
jgi:hypothetical protein